MDEEWFRMMLIEAHNNQRAHMKWIISGLSKEDMRKVVSPNERLSSIQVMLWHIGSSETYWFYKSGHPIGKKYDADELDLVLKKLDENTERIAEVVNTCSLEQLRIVPPSPEGGPSVAWATIRTYMHGIYHTGQIAKIRRMAGMPALPEIAKDLWGLSVDSVSDIIHGLLTDAIRF